VFSAWSSLVAGDIAAVEPQLASAEQQLVSEADGPDHESEAGEELDSLPVTIAMYRAAIAMASGDILAIRTHAHWIWRHPTTTSAEAGPQACWG
jgi:LuxR family maltose regulon positive regulatory protein